MFFVISLYSHSTKPLEVFFGVYHPDSPPACLAACSTSLSPSSTSTSAPVKSPWVCQSTRRETGGGLLRLSLRCAGWEVIMRFCSLHKHTGAIMCFQCQRQRCWKSAAFSSLLLSLFLIRSLNLSFVILPFHTLQTNSLQSSESIIVSRLVVGHELCSN